MNNTLKLLAPLADLKLSNESLETLALMYQQKAETVILATCFLKVFSLIHKLSNNYWGLTSEDIASWSLEKLDMCLKNYNSENSFSTYYYVVLKNKFREETEKLNYKKNKCILCSINELVEMGIEDTYNFIEMILPTNLTEKEFIYCELASQGYDNAYIADFLQVSKMTISNIRKSLKVKFETLPF